MLKRGTKRRVDIDVVIPRIGLCSRLESADPFQTHVFFNTSRVVGRSS